MKLPDAFSQPHAIARFGLRRPNTRRIEPSQPPKAPLSADRGACGSEGVVDGGEVGVEVQDGDEVSGVLGELDDDGQVEELDGGVLQ